MSLFEHICTSCGETIYSKNPVVDTPHETCSKNLFDQWPTKKISPLLVKLGARKNQEVNRYRKTRFYPKQLPTISAEFV